MSCRCGSADMRQHEAVSRLDGIRYSLSFAECRACGRVSAEALRSHGTLVCRDIDARLAFQRLRNDSVHPEQTESVPGEIGNDETTPISDDAQALETELANLALKSDYRPYRSWFATDGRAIPVLLVWIEPETAVVAAPDLALIERGHCLIETSARLSHAIGDKLALPAQFSQTCSQPFPIRWGQSPADAQPVPDQPRSASSGSSDKASPIHDSGEQLPLF